MMHSHTDLIDYHILTIFYYSYILHETLGKSSQYILGFCVCFSPSKNGACYKQRTIKYLGFSTYSCLTLQMYWWPLKFSCLLSGWKQVTVKFQVYHLHPDNENEITQSRAPRFFHKFKVYHVVIYIYKRDGEIFCYDIWIIFSLCLILILIMITLLLLFHCYLSLILLVNMQTF